jgi:hypothetical protein
LRKRKFDHLRTTIIPPEALPGSLVLNTTRCGKPNCHCANGDGHQSWLLVFMANGKKRVERVPQEWVEEVRQRVEAGRALKEAIADILAANAELLVLARRQRRTRGR